MQKCRNVEMQESLVHVSMGHSAVGRNTVLIRRGAAVSGQLG